MLYFQTPNYQKSQCVSLTVGQSKGIYPYDFTNVLIPYLTIHGAFVLSNALVENKMTNLYWQPCLFAHTNNTNILGCY